MPAALAEISCVSAKLDTSFQHPGLTLLTSWGTSIIPSNTEVVSMKAEDSGVEAMMAGDSGLAAILW